METTFLTIMAGWCAGTLLYSVGWWCYERGKSDAWKVVTEIIEELKQEEK